jgi:hypothetical protein
LTGKESDPFEAVRPARSEYPADRALSVPGLTLAACQRVPGVPSQRVPASAGLFAAVTAPTYLVPLWVAATVLTIGLVVAGVGLVKLLLGFTTTLGSLGLCCGTVGACAKATRSRE